MIYDCSNCNHNYVNHGGVTPYCEVYDMELNAPLGYCEDHECLEPTKEGEG